MVGSSRSDFGRVQGNLPAYIDDASDPLKIGGRAWAGIPTPSTDAHLINTWHDLYGRIIVAFENAAVTSSTKGPTTASITGISDTVILASPGTGNSHRISSIYASDLDPTFSLNLTLKQGSTSRVISKLHLDGGGYVWNFEPGGWILDNNQALLGVLNTTSSSGVQVNVMYRVIATP